MRRGRPKGQNDDVLRVRIPSQVKARFVEKCEGADQTISERILELVTRDLDKGIVTEAEIEERLEQGQIEDELWLSAYEEVRRGKRKA